MAPTQRSALWFAHQPGSIADRSPISRSELNSAATRRSVEAKVVDHGAALFEAGSDRDGQVDAVGLDETP